MATYNPPVAVATQARNGPLVASMSASEVTVLAANYVTDYANFVRLLDIYVNTELYTLEQSQPEETAMELIIPGLAGNALSWAPAIDSQWQQGKIKQPTTGKPIAAWPGASQLAYSDAKGNTLTLRWVKQDPMAWILIGVIVALILIYAVSLLRQSPYTMTAYTPTTSTGGTPTTTPGQAASGALSWLVKNWQVSALVVTGLIAAPFVVRHVAQTREAENELKYAERGGR